MCFQTFVAMLEMKALISSCVGQPFWHGASAHLRHLSASNSAPLSVRVVCLISEKSFFKLQPYKVSRSVRLLAPRSGHNRRDRTVLHFLFCFQCFFSLSVAEVGLTVAVACTRGCKARICTVSEHLTRLGSATSVPQYLSHLTREQRFPSCATRKNKIFARLGAHFPV